MAVMTDSWQYDPGGYDKTKVSHIMNRFRGDGVCYEIANKLLVYANTPAAMNVLVATGGVQIQGCGGVQSSIATLTIAAANSTLDRIDVIVARQTPTGSPGNISLEVLTGTAASSPTAPALTQTVDGVWEIALAYVTVAANTTAITTAMITAAASQPLCGWSVPFLGGITISQALATSLPGSLTLPSAQIHGVADPNADTDADNRGSRNTAISAAVASAFASAANPYGDGSDGTVTISSNTSISGLKQYQSLTLNAGVTLSLTGNTVIFCKGTVTINGTVNGVGTSPCIPGSAVTSTNTSGNAATNFGILVNGPAGGDRVGLYFGGAGSGYYSGYPQFGAAFFGVKTLAGLLTTIDMLLSQKFGAASGGSGGNEGSTSSGAGGRGGACLIIVAPNIVVASGATIILSGTNGSAATGSASAGGGGGSNGGVLVLAGRAISNSGTFTSAAGAGGAHTGTYGTDGNPGTAGQIITVAI